VLVGELVLCLDLCVGELPSQSVSQNVIYLKQN
jgi:hypothetical protein